ncbi:forkhead box protein R1 [Hippoglossus hippoglossus]|uniref:forkhead box protein R1 n=1 Tax=Hippoglossus hippoglossus TaxID=8267 RepID=UPI00148E7029|nr:forkhead box protein R1 [Hippoglossus hippoglossus]
MTLHLKTSARLFDLHGTVGLTDWDLDKELKLATISDQFYHDEKLVDQYVVQRPSVRASRRKDEFVFYDKTSDTFVKPSPWLLVNPNIVCPIPHGPRAADYQLSCEPAEEVQTSLLSPADKQHAATAELHVFALQEELLHPGSTEDMIKDEDVSRRPAKNRRKGRTTKVRDSKNLTPECWPRPPVNYCILIALALNSSHSGSLKVQQIYNFIREHFPFFQTAPDGWKNTIRHNLCFSNSFRKTCNQLRRDEKRKSCFWHLTLDGQRRLHDEIRTLTLESSKQLERSMSHPDIIQSLL